jgi:S1-C subfamily serine protease
VFVIPPQPEPQMPKPRLGVRLDMAEGAVRIDGVMAGSVAEQNGLKAGDLIVQAGGSPPADVQALIRLVQRHPAGTGLPLQIRRGAEMLEVVVQFPAEP